MADGGRVNVSPAAAPPVPAGPAAPAAPVGPRVTFGQMLAAYAGPTAPPSSRAPDVAPVRSAAAVAPAVGADLGLGPVARPLADDVGSGYGTRRHPVHGDVRMHHGIDIGAPTGTPIRAFAGGTVVFAGPRGGYGNLVIIDHGSGITSRYAHASTIDVGVGQTLPAGTVIGRVGATGTATGPHLHFELRRGDESFDPAPFLPAP